MSDELMSATAAMVELVWQALQAEIAALKQEQARFRSQAERAETAGGVPASTLASAPLAATGGLSNGTSYADLLWIADGRKSGEGAGAGTGVLAVYSAALDQWLNVDGYGPVLT